MNIAHIAPVFPPHASGMANAAFLQCRELARLGHQVTVFTPQYSRSQSRVEIIEGVTVRRLLPLVHWGNAASIPSLLWRLKNFDSVQLHYPFFGGVEWVLLAHKIGIIKKLLVYYHMDAQMSGVAEVVGNAYERLFLAPLMRAADRLLVSSMDYFQHSRIASRNYCGRKNFRMEKIIEVPLGIDVSKFSAQGGSALGGQIPNSKFQIDQLRKKLGIKDKEKVILFVGAMDRAHYFKGVEVLLAAFQKVVTQQPDVILLLVGDGDLRPKYELLSRDLGVEKHVRFIGRASDQELPMYYHLADVTVLPSINSAEAYGLVILESLACGTPVIASDLPGVRTLVKEGITGHLVPVGDVHALADRMQTILAHGVPSFSDSEFPEARSLAVLLAKFY